MAIIDGKGVHRRLKIMLGSETLADDYIRRYGYTIHIAKVNGLKFAQEYREQIRRGPVVPVETPANDFSDPIFEIQVKCPACYMTQIPYWDQKARSLASFLDKFQMPSYKPMGAFRAVDYNLIAVTICPQCLFASPDKKDFICRDPARNNEIPPRLHQGDLAQILAAADNRTSILEESGVDVTADNLFARERTPKAAILAYQLAIERARIESTRNVTFSLFKMGGYSHKQALIARTYKLEETPYLEAALEFYKQSFERSNAPGLQYEGNTLYQIIALNLRLGREADAGTFLAVLEKTKAEAVSPDTNFTRWYNSTRELWSDRDSDDLWTS